MIDDSLQEQAALYALGTLRGEELQAFEAQLSANGELQALVAAWREIADGLAFALPPVAPPAAVKERLFGNFRPAVLAPPVFPVTPDTGADKVVSIRASRMAGATKLAAMVALLATGFAVFQAIIAHRERDQRGAAEKLVKSLEQERHALQAEKTRLTEASQQTAALLATALRDVETSAGAARKLEADLAAMTEQHSTVSAELVKLQAESGYDKARIALLKTTPSAPRAAARAVAVSVWDQAKQNGVLLVENLPVLPATKNYQLWVLDNGAPVSAGVLTLDGKGNGRVNFSARKPVNTASVFAVTVEPLGEQESPTLSGMVLAGQ